LRTFTEIISCTPGIGRYRMVNIDLEVFPILMAKYQGNWDRMYAERDYGNRSVRNQIKDNIISSPSLM